LDSGAKTPNQGCHAPHSLSDTVGPDGIPPCLKVPCDWTESAESAKGFQQVADYSRLGRSQQGFIPPREPARWPV